MSELKKINIEFKEWNLVDSNEPNIDSFGSSEITESSNDINFFSDKYFIRSLNLKQVQEISLVLASQNIEHWTYSFEHSWMLLIDKSLVKKSQKLLKLYTQENKKVKQLVPNLELSLSPLIILIVPILFYFWSMADIFDPWAIRQAGKSIAANILDGEWWRCITALTLHANAKHFLSNIISGYFILNLLFLRRNPIKASAVVLLAAISANFFVAFTIKESFSSLGFSTYVFASLGALALVEAIEATKNDLDVSMWRKLQPLYSAFLIAVMLGVGENSDILAHFYGFILGVICSLIFLRKHSSNVFIKIKTFILFMIYGVFAISWYFAYFRYIY